jgi:[ribosomal protein S18]-alanine N-acetyltransferase
MIRECAGNDIDAVQKLIASVPEAAQWSAGDLLLALRNNLFLRIAEERGSICGVIVFRVMADEAEILNLAVASDLRRRGIGSSLLEEAVCASKAACARKIFLEVRESNDTARNFYARRKFIEAGRRREYYREPSEDALILFRMIE